MIKDERLYIAAPVCFYPRGRTLWGARRDEAEFYGFTVTCPAAGAAALPDDPREKSKAIFGGCADMMADSTACIADLEGYRGFMPDGGTVFEVGMAYGRGLKLYGFTRDLRGMGAKYMGGSYERDCIRTPSGAVLPNPRHPFDACLTAACKLVEGSFSDCLRTFMEDLERQSKQKAVRGFRETRRQPGETMKRSARPIVYVADFRRYEPDAADRYRAMRRVLDRAGFDAIFPTDAAPGVPVRDYDDPTAALYNRFDHYQQHVRNCDIVFANLNDWLGYEPASDAGFECGMGYELGKKLFGFMDDAGPVRNRVPCTEKEPGRCRDINGMTVENLGSAQNLMFGASTEIFGGGFEAAVQQLAARML